MSLFIKFSSPYGRDDWFDHFPMLRDITYGLRCTQTSDGQPAGAHNHECPQPQGLHTPECPQPQGPRSKVPARSLVFRLGLWGCGLREKAPHMNSWAGKRVHICHTGRHVWQQTPFWANHNTYTKLYYIILSYEQSRDPFLAVDFHLTRRAALDIQNQT